MDRESLEKPEWLQGLNFHPVINLPNNCYVHDFSNGEDLNPTDIPYSIGRYNEVRNNMYTSDIFVNEERNIHIGIDIAAPIGDPIHSFYEGEIFKLGINDNPGDYGPTLVLKHQFGENSLFSLYGHLSKESLKGKNGGQKVRAGEVIATVGDETVNGGWFPHLHFQLSLEAPTSADMPGVVSKSEHFRALKIYPDPRWVLGPLYP